MDATSGAVYRRYGIAMTEIIMLLKLCAVIVIFLMLLAAAVLLIVFIVVTLNEGRKLLKEQRIGKRVRTGKARKKDPKGDKEEKAA